MNSLSLRKAAINPNFLFHPRLCYSPMQSFLFLPRHAIAARDEPNKTLRMSAPVECSLSEQFRLSVAVNNETDFYLLDS